jgi:hypothetical protein
MAAYNKFEIFVGDLGIVVHNLNVDTYHVYASNDAPSASLDNVKADLAEITAQFGYPAGGSDISASYSEAGGIGSFLGSDVTWTAVGGSFGPLQYIALYNQSTGVKTDPLISWWDHGSSVTINDGESFTVDFGTEVFTIQ